MFPSCWRVWVASPGPTWWPRVTAAGGFGFLGMVRESPELIRSEIGRVRAATSRDFGVNLIPAATDSHLLESELQVVIDEHIPAVTLFWDLRPDIVRRSRDSGCLVLCQVGSIQEAEEAVRAGANIVIAQGFEAGGHVRGRAKLAALVLEVVAHVDVPVLAAGGIVNGSGLAAVLRWGAQGAVVGTGFLATRESFAHDYHKNRVVEAKLGDHGSPFSVEQQ
jgi:nitronate monooxygenase